MNKSLLFNTWPILKGLMLASLIVLSAPSAALTEQLTVSPKIKIKTSSAAVEISADTRYPHTLTMLADPPRAVLDIHGLTIPKPRQLELPKHPLIRAIRVGRHPGFTRVVMDLAALPPRPPTVELTGSKIAIIFPVSDAEVQQHSSKKIPDAAAPRIISVARLEFTATPTNTPAPTLTTTATITPSATATPSATPSPTFTPTLPATPAPAATPTPNIELTPLPTRTNPAKTVDQLESMLAPSDDENSASTQPNGEISIAETALKFTVNTMVAHIPFEGRGVQDVTVRNRSERALFMRASVLLVKNPGETPEELEPTSELLASPRRFTLEKGQERALRLVVGKRSDVSRELVFRVQLVPDVDPFDSQTGSAQLQVTAGIAILVTLGPENPKADIHWRWRNNTLTLENQGNVNVLLERGQGCVKEKCSALPSRRLYPGGKWEMRFKKVDSVEFVQRAGNEFGRLIISKE
jgi:P pilus assembly chaperone PapD